VEARSDLAVSGNSEADTVQTTMKMFLVGAAAGAAIGFLIGLLTAAKGFGWLDRHDEKLKSQNNKN
jgi:gas vesicle protein